MKYGAALEIEAIVGSEFSVYRYATAGIPIVTGVLLWFVSLSVIAVGAVLALTGISI